MSKEEQETSNRKPITSIVDHLFKEFLAKKSEVLQCETKDSGNVQSKEEIGNRNTVEEIRGKHHEKKKDKKHKKHKHKEKDHSKKRHKDKHRKHQVKSDQGKPNDFNMGNDEEKMNSDDVSDSREVLLISDEEAPPHSQFVTRTEDVLLTDNLNMDSKRQTKQHRRHRKEKNDRKTDTTGHHTLLEHLWQEEELSDGISLDIDEVSKDSNMQDESTTESEPAPNRSGSSWMILPKDLEKNPDVNADTWMKLPDDMADTEKENPSDNESVDKVKRNSVCCEAKNDTPELKEDHLNGPSLKLNLKVDITQVAKVLPPPVELVSSIKNTLINDIRKLEETPGNSNDNLSVAKVETLSECSGVKQEREPHILSKPPNKKVNLGIKISETSAALISSGKKVEDVKQNISEAETADTAAPTVRQGSPSKHPDTDGSSGVSVSQLSSSDSPGESDSDNKDDDRESSKRKERKHKKKKKSHKKRKHSKHVGRSHSLKKHRHSRSRSTSRSRSPSASRSKSRSRSRTRSRSRSRRNNRAKSFDEERGVWRSRSRSRSQGRKRSRSPDSHRHYRDNYSKYRSSAHDRHHPYRRPIHHYRHRSRSKSKSKSRSHSRSRSPIGRGTGHDDRLHIDKAQLRKIAFQNAYSHLRKGKIPNLRLKPAEVAALKAGGKSIEELTDFCKKIVEKGESFQPSDDSEDDGKDGSCDSDLPFVHHPFRMRDNASIVMNIRNARQLPVLTSTQKQALGNELRLQFPVSSGTHHRDKEREWVPVETTTATTTTAVATNSSASGDPKSASGQLTAAPAASEQPVPDDKVFPDIPNVQISIKDVVSERLCALRKLSENPHDTQAMGIISKAQEAMNKWVQSKDLPGYFTGSTGANVLSQAELAGMHQAWARKDQLINAAPVSGGIGKLLLKKMGWKEGEGLGKAGAGSKEPLMLDFKLDRKGLASTGEATKRTPTIPLTKDLSNKHPVSALVELCNRRKWQPPNFVLVHESGPDHKKNFLFKVIVNGNEYQSTIVSTNKKHAKAQAATVCLQQLGLVPP